MRSKEVDEAIKSFKEDMEIKRDETCWYHEKTSTGDCFTCPNRCGTTFIRNTKILNYISELEKENIGLLTRLRADSLIDRDNYWRDKIRDKIKELEKMREHYDKNEDAEWGEFNQYEWINYFIEKLKELLGE